MRDAEILLWLVTEALPVTKKKHNLTIGAGGRLCLSVWLAGTGWQQLYFEDCDLDRPVGDLVNEALARVAHATILEGEGG